jgi:hypothetical protein
MFPTVTQNPPAHALRKLVIVRTSPGMETAGDGCDGGKVEGLLIPPLNARRVVIKVGRGSDRKCSKAGTAIPASQCPVMLSSSYGTP